jgi:hypothetical protein
MHITRAGKTWQERTLLQVAAVLALLPASLALAAAAPAPAAPNMLPDRLLTCKIGRVTNFDPHIVQLPRDLRFEGSYSLSMFLPSVPAFVGRPPDPGEEAPPVDPRTRIVSDPDHITGQPDGHFGRIVDMWPQRVEFSTSIDGPLLNLIVIHPIDTAHGTASLFMLRATELTKWQADHVYQGTCEILEGEAARNALTPSA